jgi:hypothetical protein
MPNPVANFLLGKGKAVAITSWYMPPFLYKNSALNLGRWSTLTEMSLFAVLDGTFTDKTKNSSSTIKPLSRTTWNERARSSMNIKKARGRLEIAASKLF